VKPERDQNRRVSYKTNWWVFGEPNLTFRDAVRDLRRFVVTTRTSRHRIFTFVEGNLIAESELVPVLCTGDPVS
jgi:hypothetical protein